MSSPRTRTPAAQPRDASARATVAPTPVAEPVAMAVFLTGVSEPFVIACLRIWPMAAGEAYPSWPRTCAASVPAERGGPARVPPPSTTSVWPVT